MLSYRKTREAALAAKEAENYYHAVTDGDWDKYEYNDTLMETKLSPQTQLPLKHYSYKELCTENKKGKMTLYLTKKILGPVKKHNKYITKTKKFHFNSLQKEFIMSRPFPKSNSDYFELCKNLNKLDHIGRTVQKNNVWRFVKGQKYQRKLKKNS